MSYDSLCHLVHAFQPPPKRGCLLHWLFMSIQVRSFPRVCSRTTKRRRGELNHHTRRVFYLRLVDTRSNSSARSVILNMAIRLYISSTVSAVGVRAALAPPDS